MSERLEIIITANDQASGVLGKVGGALGSIGSIAGGILTAGLFQRIGSEIWQMGSDALDATASWERLGMSMTTMAAREMRNADSTLTMAQSMALAGDKAESLMGWIEQLAIASPFDAESIGASFRQAMTYGFTADEAQKLTQVLVDMSAGMGLTSDKMGLVSYALGQINQADKLLMLDLRQLMNAGVPVNDILKTMGYSLADVGKEAISSKDFIAAFNKTMGEDFAGAAQKQSTGWSGLMNSMSDIKKIGLREYFSSMFDAIQPQLANVVAKFSDPAIKDSLREWGKPLGEFATKVIDLVPQVMNFVAALQTKVDLVKFFAQEPLALFSDLLGMIKDDIMGLAGGAELPSFGEVVKTAMSGIATALKFVIDHWDTFKAVAIAVGAVLAGAAVAGAVASLAATIASLMTPMGLVIAIAALLAVAWGENWGGIQQKTAAVVAWLKTALASGMQFISDLTSGKLGAMSEIWTRSWATIKNNFNTSVENIKSIFKIFSMAFKGDWEGVGTELRAIWDRTWAAVKQTVETTGENIKTAFSAMIKNITEKFKSTDWKQLGNDIIQGLINGLLAMLSPAIDAALKIAKGIADALAGAFDMHSPSKLTEKMGNNIMRGLANGISGMAGLPINMALTAASGVATAVGTYASGGVPAMSASGAASGGVNVTLNYSPMLSTASADELQSKLMPFMMGAIRQSRSGVGL